MNLLDKTVYTGVAIFYNLFVHHLVNSFYKSLPYEEKLNKSTTFIFIAGIVGVILAKLFSKDRSVLSTGFNIGGVLLLLTAIFVSWENISDDIKLCISACLFALIIWYAHKYDNK